MSNELSIKGASHDHVTITGDSQKNSKYNLRSGPKTNQQRISTTNYDVTTNTQDTQRSNTKAPLPIYTAKTQQLTSNKQQNFINQMDCSNNNSNSPMVKSPVQKTPLSISNYLSPTPKISPLPSDDQQLPKHLENAFNAQLIAALINRDTVLREIRECITTDNQARCKRLSRQIHAKWGSLSVNNGCILVDNKLAIPNTLKESVMDALHATHPGAWGMTELGQSLWWPFINRDLINKSKTCRPCTEESKKYNKYQTLKLVSNADGPNIEKFLKNTSPNMVYLEILD